MDHRFVSMRTHRLGIQRSPRANAMGLRRWPLAALGSARNVPLPKSTECTREFGKGILSGCELTCYELL